MAVGSWDVLILRFPERVSWLFESTGWVHLGGSERSRLLVTHRWGRAHRAAVTAL